MDTVSERGGQSLMGARAAAAGEGREARQAAAQAASAGDRLHEVVEKWIDHLSHPAPTPELQRAREEELHREIAEANREAIAEANREAIAEANREANLKAIGEANREEQRKNMLRERLQDPARIAEERYLDNTIAVDEDSRRTTMLDIHWYDGGITYADLFPKMYAGRNVKASPAPVEPFPYMGPDEIRVVKKGSCTCTECGCAGLDPP